MNKNKKAIEQIENKQQATDTLEYLTMLKAEMNEREMLPNDFNTYEKLGEMEHSLYRYNLLLNEGLTDDAEKEGKNFFSISQSPDGAIMLKGGISNSHYLWETEAGACEACEELDGQIFNSLDDVPDRPHPNCKCKITLVEDKKKEEEKERKQKNCIYLQGLSIMQASLNNSEQEINDCINNVEIEISDFQAQKEEADNFYEMLKEEWNNFIEEIKQLHLDYAIQEPQSLSKYITIIYALQNISLSVILSQLYSAYNVYKKYANLSNEIFNDLGICTECKDKWKHANVNYECVKLGLLGEQIAIAISIAKEIKDLKEKIIDKKLNALEMIKDSLEDLKADYFGILQAKNNLQNGINLEEFKKIFQKKKKGN